MTPLPPVDMVFDGVRWEPVALSSAPNTDGVPTVTHEGVLDLAGHKLRVLQLSDGRRIIDADDLAAFFEGWAP